jgi:predicted transcriptional regulator
MIPIQTVNICFRASPNLKARLEAYAHSQDQQTSAFIRNVLSDALKREAPTVFTQLQSAASERAAVEAA